MITINSYPNYILYEDGRVYSNKRNIFLKPQTDSCGYLHVALLKDGKAKIFRIHKLIAIHYLNHIPCGYDKVIDHIDNNKLNNHYSNLQIVSARKNTSKDRLKRGNLSKSVGVYFLKRTGKWKATIYYKKSIHLGYFLTEKEAKSAYDNAFELYK